MTAKSSNNNPHDDHDGDKPRERIRNHESSSDDESVSDDDSRSSSSSAESSIENTSTGSPPPDSIMNGDQIRKTARELLLTSPDGVASLDYNKNIGGTASAGRSNPAANASGYQSYHDAPTVRMSSNSQFASPHAATPPWSSQNESEEGLSMTEVASMAFTCVAHCLTEGYRAASTYYSGYEQNQYPSVSGPDNSQNYQKVSGYQHEAYSNRSASYNDNDDQQSSSINVGYKNGYSDGYQTKLSECPNQHREIMERGGLPRSNDNECAGQTSGEGTVQKEEWATVHVPSTYQGGKVGGGN